jgi:hypothetical protein
MAEAARKLNPAAHLIPAGAEGVQGLEDEIAKWDKQMADKNSEYWKGPNAEKIQARYRDLVKAREAMKK